MNIKKIYSETGLVMIPVGSDWAIGYMPERKTFCLGELSELADLHSENDYALIRFVVGPTGLRPIEVLCLTQEEIQERRLQPNEVRVKLGCHFTQPANFSTQTVNP